ncbi:hypothetical protein D3C87_1422580 [compost metagenome]
MGEKTQPGRFAFFLRQGIRAILLQTGLRFGTVQSVGVALLLCQYLLDGLLVWPILGVSHFSH